MSATVELPNAKKILIYAGIGIGALVLLLIAFLLGRKAKKPVADNLEKDVSDEDS